MPPKKPPETRLVFAMNLRASRRQAQLSQRELARLSELAPSFVSGVENGRRNISLDAADRLAKTVGAPLWKLLEPPSKARTK